ncbi:MAG: hypothetical protein M3065_01450 [Actinomycetota bacterium]|nr:hypothetical protein [Actinomycetota bacterium]
MDPKTKTTIAALKAAGYTEAAAITAAIMGQDEPPETAGPPNAAEPDPAAITAAGPAEIPAGLREAAAAAGPGIGAAPTGHEEYATMSAAELADLPEAEYKRALKLLTRSTR